MFLLPFWGEEEEELKFQINFDKWVQGEDTGKLETEAVCEGVGGGVRECPHGHHGEA